MMRPGNKEEEDLGVSGSVELDCKLGGGL